MPPTSTMKTTTVHRIGILFRKAIWKLSWVGAAVWLGLGLLAARGQAKLNSMAPPYSRATMLPGLPDHDVAQEVAQVDHAGRRDRDDPGARVLDERHRGQQGDHDARPHRRV